MSQLLEAIKEFLIETQENLDQLDLDLVSLEKASAPGEILGRIFRTLHTIKGSCSFLNFPHLEALSHAGETLLGKLRDGRLSLSPVIFDGLLRMVDAIRKMLDSIENTGSDGNPDEPELIALLDRLSNDNEPPLQTRVAHQASHHPAVEAMESDFALSGDVDVSQTTMEAATEPEPTSNVDGSAVYDSSIRVNVDLLDKLMTIAGEIVLARNQILQYSQLQGDPSFQNTCRQLNLITTELQEHVMKTRLQPIGNVWNRFPRLVRDTANACGKKVRLETEGSETELDKTLIEAIRDPLTHLVRNAIDHGIEAPTRRQSVGKAEEGCVRLRAYHEGGQVNVEISDDGAGIDMDRVKLRAIEQRLITTDQAADMSTQSLLALLFLPGFSTAPTVTTLSGRGVGMDIVKTNIEKMGGSVDIHSTLGQGTTVRIRIPLTLAIIKVLVVTSAGDRYAVPQVSIVELVRVEGDKARKGIQRVHGVSVYRYRDRLLPLVNLNQVLKINPTEVTSNEVVNIVVLQAGDLQFGLIVDQINDTQEIVVKPLWKHLKSLACFAGATVMGDGRVALILDVFGLAQRAGAVSGLQSRVVSTETQSVVALPAERLSVLLVEGRDRSRMAIPIDKVARLEEFPQSSIERVANRRVVQYCEQILPLLDVETVMGSTANGTQRSAEKPQHAEGPVQVVVYSQGERPVGLVVKRILDIVERDSDVQGAPSRRGVSCTAVIHGQVTELLDVASLIQAAEEV